MITSLGSARGAASNGGPYRDYQWESDQALAAAFSAVRAAGLDFDYDDRESRPREVLKLASA